ncbi:MAG TPA: hypothetical protein P5201_13695, partial [Aminobacteriaceae bacterium]|nr:hypothetical protein [Aminobacteriaceae bacterium]
PVQFGERPPAPSRAPEHGQHTEEILMELNIDWDGIAAAKEAGLPFEGLVNEVLKWSEGEVILVKREEHEEEPPPAGETEQI